MNNIKYLIVGLGNIGCKYKNTRHNIGFKIVDYLCSYLNGEFKVDKFGLIANCLFKNKKIIILKPNTYMNFSGISVRYYLNLEKILKNNLMIIVDDLYLDFGKIKIKRKGKSNGHNGLKNIEKELFTQNYNRLRFGIDNKFKKGNQINYVLGDWTNKEKIILNEKIKLSIEVIKSFINLGLDKTMNIFN